MLKTLDEEPEKFLENNLGISVIASKVEQESSKKFKITFPSDTGILNGGHTQAAILDSKTNPNIANAIVKLSVREKTIDFSRIAEIAAAQNSSTAVKEYSVAEKKGLFAKLKRYMEDRISKHIIWYEGKTVAADLGMEPPDLIAILNLFDIDNHMSNYSSSSSQPTASCSSKSTVFNNWVKNPKSLEIIYPLINDIMDLSERLQMKLHKKTEMARLQIIQDSSNSRKQNKLIFSGNIPDYNIPKAFLYSVLAAFRANVWYDNANKKIGWFEDPKKYSMRITKHCSKRYQMRIKPLLKMI